MAGITEYLKKILSSVYGRDVRQAIHDAIQQCYIDANGEAKVDKKQGTANAGKVLGIGNDGAVKPVEQFSVAAKSIGTEKLADHAVTEEKLADAVNKKIDQSISDVTELKDDLNQFKEDIYDVELSEKLTPIQTLNGYRVSISNTYGSIAKTVDATRSINIYQVKRGKKYKVRAFGYDRDSFYIGGIADANIADVVRANTVQKILCGTDVYPSGYTYHDVEFISVDDGFLCLTFITAQDEATTHGEKYILKENKSLDYAVINDYAIIKEGDEYNCVAREFGNTYKSRVYKHSNANNLFQLYHLGYGTFDGASYVENTSVMTASTDIVGPASIGRWDASTGFESCEWSGGNHDVTVDGVRCRTAKETHFKATCDGVDITNANDGVYLGKAVFISENDLYFPQTITGATFDGATKALHEKRQYIVDYDMKVKVSLDVLYDDVGFSAYYGMQNILHNVVNVVEHPTMLARYTDMNGRFIFDKESKVFYLSRNDGWCFDMVLDDVGLANREQLRMDEAYFNQYGYGKISNGKIYQCLIQGKHFPNGTELMWSGTYKFYYA